MLTATANFAPVLVKNMSQQLDIKGPQEDAIVPLIFEINLPQMSALLLKLLKTVFDMWNSYFYKDALVSSLETDKLLSRRHLPPPIRFCKFK